MTILEVIQRSSEFLGRQDVESPRLQIELLLAHVLQLPRMQLYLSFERVLAEPELSVLRQLVKRRAAREPLQHLIGSTSFCGLELEVGPQALVPRPETETLAELARKAVPSAPAAPRILDLGTGTGCLAIYLAVQCPAAVVHAVEVSPEALALAQRNAARHGVSERIQFHPGDRFDGLPPGQRHEVIVSNPPYIATAEIASLEPEVRDHDPRLALDGGPDGLDFYRWFAAKAEGRLAESGRLLLEFGDGQADAIRAIFVAAGWRQLTVENDLSKRARVLVAAR